MQSLMVRRKLSECRFIPQPLQPNESSSGDANFLKFESVSIFLIRKDDFLVKLNHISRNFTFLIVLALTVALSACSTGSNSSTSGNSNGSEQYYTEGKPVTLVAPSSPGGGWDLTARSLAETFQKENLIDSPVQVVNEPGAHGAVSLSQLVTQHKGDAYKISVTSLPIQINNLVGRSDYGYKDVTMIARLMTEYFMVVTPKDSPYKTLKDLLNAVKKNPASIPIGGASEDRLVFALLVDAVGGDPKKVNFISYKGGGKISNALLNGDIKAAISGASEFIGQVKAGNFRGLAVTSEERLSGVLKDIPTATESGVDVTFGNWRGIMGPPDMPVAAENFWENKIEKSLNTVTWKEIAKKNKWVITYMKDEEFQQFLEKTNNQIKNALQKTGQLK